MKFNIELFVGSGIIAFIGAPLLHLTVGWWVQNWQAALVVFAFLVGCSIKKSNKESDEDFIYRRK